MFCPNCGKELEDEAAVCPACGASLTSDSTEDTTPAAEAPAEEAAAPAEETEAAVSGGPAIILETADASEEAADSTEKPDEGTESAEGAESTEAAAEAPAEAEQPKKKSKAPVIIISIVIVLLLAIIACLGYAVKHVSDGGSISDLLPKHEKKLDADAVAVELNDADGNTVAELTNEQFAFYYWGEYYYYVNSYGFSFDASTPLDEQIYQEADSSTGTEEMTWQDYFMQSALYSYNQTQALIKAADAEGFLMTDEYHDQYQQVIDELPDDAISAGFTDEDGNADVLGYIQESYGSNATEEDFEQYIYDSYYAAAYSDAIYYGFTFTEDELSDYFDENADTYAGYGVEKSDTPDVNVRHILIQPEEDTTDEDGNAASSDEAWDAAKEKAEELLKEWEDGDATEDSFAELANENSADTGSNTTGGLYEDVYPGEMVTEFNDWCFDADRKAGDTGIIKTDYGYHIMYFVSATDTYYWETVADSDLRYQEYNNKVTEVMEQYTAELTDKADVVTPDAVTALAEQYASSSSTTASTAG